MGQYRTQGSKTAPRTIAAQERVAEALALRTAGASFVEIAEKCGYKNPQRAHEAVRRAIVALPRERAMEARIVEQDRLDKLMMGVWDRAVEGDIEAGDYVLRVMKRRAALSGLDLSNPDDNKTPVEILFKLSAIVLPFVPTEKREELLATITRQLGPPEAEREELPCPPPPPPESNETS